MNDTHTHIKTIEQSLKRLQPLIDKLINAKNIKERLEILDHTPDVKDFLQKSPQLKNYLSKLNEKEQFILKSLLALGQGDIIFQGLEKHDQPELALKQLLES